MRKLLLLVFSVILISCSPIRKYQSLPEVRAWESDIHKFEQLDVTETYPDDAILFAGSSSIRMWSTLAQDMAPYNVIQRGYGGSKLSDFAVYAGRIFDPHPCQAIVLFVANDIIGGDQDKSPAEVAGLFSNVLKTIRKKHPVTPVFWIAVTPTASRWTVWPEIQEAGKLIKKICDSKANTYYITTDYAFLGKNGQPTDELFRDDRLHLTASGYAIWTDIIKDELDRILK